MTTQESSANATGRDALERIREPTIATDAAGTVTLANDAASALLVSGASALVGQSAYDLFDDVFEEGDGEALRRAAEAGETARFEAVHDPSDRRIEIRAYPGPDGMTLCLRDRGDAFSDVLSEAVDVAADGIAILEDGEYVYMNRSHAEIFGFEPSELMGDSWERLYGESERDRIAEAVIPHVESEGTWHGELTGRRRDGSEVHQQVELETLDGGHLVCTNRDISEQKRRDQALDRQRTRLRALFDKSPDGIVVHDADGAVIDVNETECETLGHDRETLLSMNVAEFEVGHDREELQAMWAEMDEGDMLKTEGEHRRADGEVFPIEVWVTKVDVDGNERFVALDRDITDRVERRRELRETKERLDLAVEGDGLGIWDWDMRTDAVTFSDQWAEILGLSPADIDPHLDTWEERVHPDDMDRVEANLNAHVDGETALYDCEHRMRTEDGEWKWIRDAGRVVERNDEGEPVRAVGIHLDISDRKEYEETLEQTRSELRQVIDLVPDLIFAKDEGGRYLLANETTAEAYGMEPESVEGKTESEIIPDADQSADFREDDLRVIESGDPVEIPEEELTTADGETRILRTTKIPYTVAGSDENAILGYARDITELKAYERKLETQRDNLGVLNQIVRHDIQNNLNIIVGYAEYLEDHVDDDGAEYLASVLRAAREAIEITTSAGEVTDLLLEADEALTRTHVSSVLQGRIDDLQSNYPEVQVTTVGRLPDASVLADDMLGSAFRNLLQNAVLHNDAAVPEVTVSATETASHVRVEIADNGPGIPDDQRDAIFEEGTQGIDSEGTGLGLYLVQTLVDRYDGSVWAEDNERDGATFVVELPRVDGSQAE